MNGPAMGLAASVFLACAVEAVEALTIVLAVGSTRDWRSTLSGVLAAIIVLAVLALALGPALTSLPIGALRVGVGGLLLVFGLQWLRKAILRACGLKALHDEHQTFAEEAQAAMASWRKAYTEAQAALASWHKAHTEAQAALASGHAPRQALLLDRAAAVREICLRW